MPGAGTGAVARPEREQEGERGTLRLVVEAMRPRQWVKNAFVLGGVVFSGTIDEPAKVAAALAAFAAFCLLSGATYLVNDAVDAESDRHSPRTAGRPIARGALPARTALWAAALAGLAALAIGAAVNLATLGVLVGFGVLQVAYSRRLKHVLFVDVMAIAAGFTLRALAGLVAPGVEISEWLLLCTALLALFLGFAKRRQEAVLRGGTAHPQRPVLEEYSVALLDELIMVVAPTTLVTYCLYAVLAADSEFMLLTAPFVLYGIFRVLFLIHHRGELEEPALAVWVDRPLQVCVLLWAATAAVIALLAT